MPSTFGPSGCHSLKRGPSEHIRLETCVFSSSVSILLYSFNLFHLLTIFIISVEVVALFNFAKNLKTRLLLVSITQNSLFGGIWFLNLILGFICLMCGIDLVDVFTLEGGSWVWL